MLEIYPTNYYIQLTLQHAPKQCFRIAAQNRTIKPFHCWGQS